jgi:hypothetical protein
MRTTLAVVAFIVLWIVYRVPRPAAIVDVARVALPATTMPDGMVYITAAIPLARVRTRHAPACMRATPVLPGWIYDAAVQRAVSPYGTCLASAWCPALPYLHGRTAATCGKVYGAVTTLPARAPDMTATTGRCLTITALPAYRMLVNISCTAAPVELWWQPDGSAAVGVACCDVGDAAVTGHAGQLYGYAHVRGAVRLPPLTGVSIGPCL